MCRCHGSGALSSLFSTGVLLQLKSMQVPQRLQLLEQAATEQRNARRGAEHALVEARNRIAQLDLALQQGGRPTTSADKWDGSEKAWPKWSFVMKAHAGAIDQELSTDMANAGSSTDVLSHEPMAGQRKARSVQLYFVLIMLCTGRALDRIANAPHCCWAWRRGWL